MMEIMTYCMDTAAILVTGGFNMSSGGVLSTVEVLHGDGSPWCSLPDLPEDRRSHTQTGLEACGGYGSSASSTCVRLEAGSWTPSHQLAEERRYHSSWASPAGTLLMGAGQPTWKSGKATELLDEITGNFAPSFPLKYKTQ